MLGQRARLPLSWEAGSAAISRGSRPGKSVDPIRGVREGRAGGGYHLATLLGLLVSCSSATGEEARSLRRTFPSDGRVTETWSPCELAAGVDEVLPRDVVAFDFVLSGRRMGR